MVDVFLFLSFWKWFRCSGRVTAFSLFLFPPVVNNVLIDSSPEFLTYGYFYWIELCYIKFIFFDCYDL